MQFWRFTVWSLISSLMFSNKLAVFLKKEYPSKGFAARLRLFSWLSGLLTKIYKKWKAVRSSIRVSDKSNTLGRHKEFASASTQKNGRWFPLRFRCLRLLMFPTAKQNFSIVIWEQLTLARWRLVILFFYRLVEFCWLSKKLTTWSIQVSLK